MLWNKYQNMNDIRQNIGYRKVIKFMQINIIMLPFLAAPLGLIVYMLYLEYKSTQLLTTLIYKYADGIDIGSSSLEMLKEALEKDHKLAVKQYSDYLIAKKGKTKVKLFLKEGKVFAEYSGEKFGITRGTLNSNRLLRGIRLKKAVAANEVMDKLAMSFNPSYLKNDSGEYKQANSYAKQYGIIFGATAVICIIFYLYQVAKDVTNTVDIVKTGTFKDYPDKEIGKTFDLYFKNTQWKEVDKKEGNEVVKFTGYFPMKDSDGKEVEMSMDFTIVKDNINFGNLTIYNKTRDENTSNIVLQKIIGKDDIQFSMEDILEMIKASDIENAENSEAKENNKVESKKNEEELNNKNEAVDSKKIENNDKIEDNPVEEEIEENIEDTANADYIIPYSDTRYLSQQDLMGMNKGTLRTARNEIYARYGRKFKAKDLQDYFNSKSWYHPTIEADQFTDNMLSETEKHNANLIKEAEAEAPAGELTIVNNELLSLGEKEKIVNNMEAYTTWEIEMKVMNEQTNEYDLWTIKDDLKNNVIAVKKNGSDWAYYDVNAGMSVGDPTFNIEKALMDDETYISGFWNARESIFKNFKPNDKYVNNGYVIYDNRPEDGQEWFVSYRFKKDSKGKLLLREIFSTRSSFNYPDEVITYKYSNEPIKIAE